MHKHIRPEFAFLLTRLMRGAAALRFIGILYTSISTHAPHARRGVSFSTFCKLPCDFYSRASCEARLAQAAQNKANQNISTHAPHARRGGYVHRKCIEYPKFLLTRLMRGAAILQLFQLQRVMISTHAPHARRGVMSVGTTEFLDNFYSRASCEARLYVPSRLNVALNFYSRASCEARPRSFLLCLLTGSFLLTRLMRGAAFFALDMIIHISISTHAPHARRGEISS